MMNMMNIPQVRTFGLDSLNSEADQEILQAAGALIDQQFDETDRIDSIAVERQDSDTVLIVNANMGNVGSGTCEFVWKL